MNSFGWCVPKLGHSAHGQGLWKSWSVLKAMLLEGK